ncbi:MAG: CPBP family intramembrane glutamic endopeptidase [Chitinophagaceae bacterium]
MNTIFKYISDYYNRTFHPVYFCLILLLIGSLIYLNYWHGLELNYILSGDTWIKRFTGYYLLYCTPLAIGFVLQLFFYKDCSYFKNRWFWVILFISPAIFSLRVNFDLHEYYITQLWSGDEQVFWTRCLNWIVRVLVLLVLIFFIWFIKDKKNQPFYGIKALGPARPYWLMLCLMAPMIVLASTQPDFLAMYPKAQFINALRFSQESWRWVVYEICYGFDFVSIEFFFRGFLILALLNICGKQCIVPVACFYCTIHFGKPLGEAISSFWGGLLLGIVSFNTRSIWGGLMVHLGIAWMMEVGGWLGALLKK